MYQNVYKMCIYTYNIYKYSPTSIIYIYIYIFVYIHANCFAVHLYGTAYGTCLFYCQGPRLGRCSGVLLKQKTRRLWQAIKLPYRPPISDLFINCGYQQPYGSISCIKTYSLNNLEITPEKRKCMFRNMRIFVR